MDKVDLTFYNLANFLTLFFRCDLLVTSQQSQRYLNLIGVVGLFTFNLYLIFLVTTDGKKLLSWMDFLCVDRSVDVWASKHNLDLKSAKILYFLYKFFVSWSISATVFYILVICIYCWESFLLSQSKGVGLITFIFIFAPTAASIILNMIWFYSTVSKIISIFILFNLFQIGKLQKLAADLAAYHQSPKKKRRAFVSKHLRLINMLLTNFKLSQEFFNHSTQCFLGPLFLTMVWYPYAYLVANNFSVKFLIISYSMNLLLLFPIFKCSSNFKRQVSTICGDFSCSNQFFKFGDYLGSVHSFVCRENLDRRIKQKLLNIFEFSSRREPLSYSYFKFFSMDLMFAFNFWAESISLVLLFYGLHNF